MNRAALDQIKNDVLVEGTEDYVGLWEVVWLVRHFAATTTALETRDAVLAVVRELLEAGYVRAGDVRGEGEFAAWQVAPHEALSRIEREWDALGYEPVMWEICSFSNTERGDAVAQARLRDETTSPDP